MISIVLVDTTNRDRDRMEYANTNIKQVMW